VNAEGGSTHSLGEARGPNNPYNYNFNSIDSEVNTLYIYVIYHNYYFYLFCGNNPRVKAGGGL
jgi:hypothetical protein